jgi:hypothetical protein
MHAGVRAHALLVGVVIAGMVGLLPTATRGTADAATPTEAITVSGAGVAMYPAFSTAVRRYGLTTTDATDGAVTVHVTSSDRAVVVRIDGEPRASGKARVSGLVGGDEISVMVVRPGVTHRYSLVYLPAGFPTMKVTTTSPGPSPGDVFLTLTDFTGTTPSYVTAVDANGVPGYVREVGPNSHGVPLDFTRQPDGDYSVYLPTPTAGRSGGEVVEYDHRFRRVGAYQTTGTLTDTDGHDAILLANGDRWLLARVTNPTTGNEDNVIQEQGPKGKVRFQWNTANHVDQALDDVGPTVDYAHINSIWLANDGDIIASFRHLSQVMDIAVSAHDGYARGEVVWRLGGRRSTFTFLNDPLGGPCGQHSASQLSNGDILLFDDGSTGLNGSPLLCVDPTDPTGPTIVRDETRVSEYALDTVTNRATLVWSYEVAGRISTFAGSAQRLSGGDTLVGWGGTSHGVLATEVGPDGTARWELSDNTGRIYTYRALKFALPDKTPPAVDLTVPARGATYRLGQRVRSAFSCTDRGGSGLWGCGGAKGPGALINTSSTGRHTYTVVATDGAGNKTRVHRTYRVTRGT